MKIKKSVAAGLAALLVGVTAGSYTNAAFAAPVESSEEADVFSDVPRDHWAYEALDYLAKEGVIDGMADGTFQGNRTMSRYEMAGIVAKAMKNGSGKLADRAMVEKLNREFGQEIKKISGQVRQLKKDVDSTRALLERVKLYGKFGVNWSSDSDNHKGDARGIKDVDEKKHNNFYLDLMADFKVNKEWTAHFESETKQGYAHSTAAQNLGMISSENDDKNGTIQRIWATADYANGTHVDIGRRVVNLGLQNSLYGDAASGVMIDKAINKNDLRIGAFYETMAEYSNADVDFWGAYIKGPVGHKTDIFAAYARTKAKYDGVDFGNPVVDKAALSYNWTGDRAILLSAGVDVAKNLRWTNDYVVTNGEGPEGADHKSNRTWMSRLDYKKADENVKGSFGIYARYHTIGREGTIWNDDEWNSLVRNSKGWTFGITYVPTKNVIWDTFYEMATMNKDSYGILSNDATNNYDRKLLRTKVDFLF